MALINCPECGKEISDSAITCPNCGVSLKKESDFDSLNNTSVKKRKTVPIVIVVIVSVFVLLAAAYFCRGLFVSEINLKCKGSTFLKIGDSTSITAEIKPSFADTGKLSWSTSDSNVATVEDGTVKTKGEGECVITAKAMNGKSESVRIVASDLKGYWTYKAVYIQGTIHQDDYLSALTYATVDINENNFKLEFLHPDFEKFNINGKWEYSGELDGSPSYKVKDGDYTLVAVVKEDELYVIGSEDLIYIFD